MTAAAVLVTLLIALPATAQQRFLGATNNITIDYAALNGSNTGRSLPLSPGNATFLNSTGKIILFPPSRSPVSRLQGSLANRSFTPTVPTRSAPVSRASVNVTSKAVKALTPVTTPKAAEVIPAPAPATPTVTAPPAPAKAPVQIVTALQPIPLVQTATTPPVLSLAQETRILFERNSPDLSDAAKTTLDALATRLNADSSLRIQLQAFAAGTDETAPGARRLSLKRALNVRAHLVERKVTNTRMDVRALGIKSTSGPDDRVDAVIVQK
ncbi:MAG: OmpA family protein [Alphaproteobacteria bacterium]|nr:OmpA family protein [Alphaproteobacteria bacterium]